MKNYIYDKQLAMFSEPKIIGYGNKDFYIKEIYYKKANEIILKNHYSHKIYNLSYIHLGIYLNDELIGIMQFGYAMNPASHINILPNSKRKEYLELNRMWFDDNKPRNAISKAFSYAIKYLKATINNLKFIQSFADERCGKYGVVYQACNFVYYGEHIGIFWEYDGQYFHNIIMTAYNRGGKYYKILKDNKDKAIKHELRQFRYIYWLKQKYRKQCLLKEKPYPKN